VKIIFLRITFENLYRGVIFRNHEYKKYSTFFFRLSVGWSPSTYGLIKRSSLKRPTPFGLSIFPRMKNRTPDGRSLL